jgi:thiamine phosphate phosphatase / amino-HMP aminohydrolase
MSLFLDFDGTITTEDTVTHLANFALRFQAEQRQAYGEDNDSQCIGVSSSSGAGTGNDYDDSATPDNVATSSLSQTVRKGNKDEADDDANNANANANDGDRDGDGDGDLSACWDAVVAAYVADYKAHVSAYAPEAAKRRHVSDEVAFLRSQKHVETRSLRRINGCALFRGIGRDAFREAGRALVRDGTVRLRPGFHGLVKAALARGRRVNVVSVNWSAAFIEGACGFDEGDGFRVISNDVRKKDGAVVGPGALTGEGLLAHRDQDQDQNQENETGDGDGDPTPLREQTSRNLTNSVDKRDAVQEVRRRQATEDTPFWYFGDSTTDMECLLEATRGVVLADDGTSTLIETLRRIGKRVPHVRDAESSDNIVWASNFEEVMNSGLGLL